MSFSDFSLSHLTHSRASSQIIYINAIKNTIDVRLTDAELARRRLSWKPREPKVKQGTLWKYYKLVGDASHGAITDGPVVSSA